MTEGGALGRLRDAMTKKPPPTPFVGAGLSSAVTGGARHASWRGLLLDGIEVCGRVSSPPPGWAGRMKDQLDNADVTTYLTVAEEISSRLHSVGGGREFDSWIQNTVGALRPAKDGQQIIDAVCGLGNIIVTTNYDTLIENLKPEWTSCTWTDDNYGEACRATEVVLHLHGVVEKPESIILSSSDYAIHSKKELTQILDRSLFASHRFIFIGCGDGLNDPDIAPLMDFVNHVMSPRKTEHYILVKGDQLRQLIDHPLSPLISPVAYGGSFKELMPFMQKLAAGEDIRVSQDPEYYEQLIIDDVGMDKDSKAYKPRNTVKPRIGLLDLASQAQANLENALKVLQQSEHAIRKVEQCGAMSSRMRDWDFAEQEAVHKELAASLTDPAAHLESCSAEVVSAFEDAEAFVWQLTAPKFAQHSARLALISETVSKLANESRQLLDSVTRAHDDLRARTEDCVNYWTSYEALHQAFTSIDRAHSIANSLKEGLRRLQAVQATGKTRAERPAANTLNADTVSSEKSDIGEYDSRRAPDTGSLDEAEIRDADFRRVPLLWEVAAGQPILPNGKNVRDYLALPAQHVRGDEVFMLEVKGESMAGEDGVLEGDYVIVNRRANWKDGDMVVVHYGEDEGGMVVKRIWREGGSIKLQSSNPSFKPIILKEEDGPTIQGKVIGVVRWHIREGRRHAEPLS